MSIDRLLNEPEEAARLLQTVSQAVHDDAHDDAKVDYAATVLFGMNRRPGRDTIINGQGIPFSEPAYSRGSTRSPSPEPTSEAAPSSDQGTKRRRREPSVLSDHSTGTPTRGIENPVTGIPLFNPWDPTTHETLVGWIRRGRYITGLPHELDPKTAKDKKISIATLRQRRYKFETRTMSWMRADPLDENGGPEGEETAVLATKAEQHFKELFPDKLFEKEKGKKKEGVKAEGDGVEEDKEDEEDDAPGPSSQAKRRKVDTKSAQPAATTKSNSKRKPAAPSTAQKGKGKATDNAAAAGRERSPETPYLTPPFSPHKQQQPGSSSFTAVNRPLLPNEPVEDLADRLLDAAGAPGVPIERNRRTAKTVTFAMNSIDEVLATGSKDGEGEKVKTTTTAKGRVVQKPKKFGE